MKKWFLPLTVLGVGGLGALFLSDKGRRALGWMSARLEEAPERIAEWNDAAQLEMERIQNALNQISASLPAKPAAHS